MKHTPKTSQTSCPCGFVSKITSEGLAQHALKLHSCDRWHRLAQRAENARERNARLDTTTRPCNHKQTQHQHGTHACYVCDRCRCTPCRTANSAYENTRAKQKAYGRWEPFVDAEPARQHVRALSAQGMGWKRIAERAQFSSGAMNRLLYGMEGRQPSRRIRPDASARILAVTLDLADGAMVDATGTWRRLEALVAIGYPKSLLAEKLGLTRALQFDRRRVQAGNATKVRDLYLELRDTPGPSQRARNDGKRNGYLTPHWWDDDLIDDPTHTPDTSDKPLHWSDVDEVAVLLATQGHDPGRPLTRAEKTHACLDLHEAGHDHGTIAHRTGINRDQVGRIIRENTTHQDEVA